MTREELAAELRQGSSAAVLAVAQLMAHTDDPAVFEDGAVYMESLGSKAA